MTEISPIGADGDTFLRQINAHLATEHARSIIPDLPENHATIYVIGVPRSGTTLMMQLMATYLPIAYPSNMSAMFWSAPTYGVALARKLFGDTPAFQSSLTSSYGRTTDPLEPHEFGRFWLELLGYHSLEEKPGHQIDRMRMRDTLVNMTEAAGRAYAFKSFLPVWHLNELAEEMQKGLFVHVVRDPLENALSLLKARRHYAETENDWFGLKPHACRDYLRSPLPVQVVSQVVEIEQSIERRLQSIDPDRVVSLRLSDLTRCPNSQLLRVADALARVQHDQIAPIPLIESLPARRPSRDMDKEDVEAVKAAFEQLGHPITKTPYT